MSAQPPDATSGVPRWMGVLAGHDAARARALKGLAVRLLIVTNLVVLSTYLVWRGLYTLNWALWPLAVLLFLAEVYSAIDTALFCLGIWRIRERGEPSPAPATATVDVFITCYNEAVDLVRATARAARDIRHPHQTWVLDDGDNPDMRAMAAAEQVGYLTRSKRWEGKQRHAKAGNLINALYETDGQFILVLDADQVPRPEILDRTLGYFDDPGVAFVQTPQWFSNTPPGDPFGTDAPLFYGPIQQGKDSWNAAFFCGSNAVLRRDALMSVGVVSYVREMDARVRGALRQAADSLRSAAHGLDPAVAPPWEALRVAGLAVREARRKLEAGGRIQDVTWEFQKQVRDASQRAVEEDVRQIDALLARTPGVADGVRMNPSSARLLSSGPSAAYVMIPELRRLLAAVDLDRHDEAEPVLPLATISVTEDMATSMRLHAMGYRSVYHHEVLAVGLAPEDLGSMLQQRLRWAQGTIQVLLRENPLTQRGLSWPQRLLYFSTMWSYLSGFASAVYLVAPILYLLFGWLPVSTLSGQFLLFLLPCLITNQLLFLLVGHGMSTWRGQQYSLALFPLWITAVVTAVRNVHYGAHLGFVVTPKTRQGGGQWSLIRPQLLLITLLAFAILRGVFDLAFGHVLPPFPILINVAWAMYSIAMLSVLVRAARGQPPKPESTP